MDELMDLTEVMREIDGLRSELAVKAYEAPDFDEEDHWQHYVEVLDSAAEYLWQYSDLRD